MNTQKVIVGGLAAGVVTNVIDFIANGFILQGTFKAAMDKLNPALSANMMNAGTLVGTVIIDFVLGLLVVWTYAAIRPRFGPGAKTAVYAGLLIWLAGGTAWALLTVLGLFTWGVFFAGAIEALISVVAGAYVGAMLYKEEPQPA